MGRMGDFLDAPALDYEAWRSLMHSHCGRFTARTIDPNAFIGRIRARRLSGLDLLDIQCNAQRIERTHQDIRLDGIDHFCALLQVAGRTTLIQNNDPVQIEVGDIVLMDASRPITTLCEPQPAQWATFHFPRRSLISHLGFEPRGGLCKRARSLAARLLFETVLDECDADASSSQPDTALLDVVIYDLVAALFASSSVDAAATPGDKLFARLCRIIKGRFAERDLSPGEVASEAGISLRYLQKLFTMRGTSYRDLVRTLRLDHAAQLLERREGLVAKPPLSEVAYASGFRDYTHFARQFRRRFGHAPGAHEDARSAALDQLEPRTIRSAQLCAPDSRRASSSAL